MRYEIRKAAVLGAGVMGASLAAHFANAGIECLLLDIVPPVLPEADGREESGADDPAWRSSLAVSALQALGKAKPAAFCTRKNAALIRPGNLTDHLAWLEDVDWVLEAVVEDLQIKQDLIARIEPYLKSTCIVS